MFLYLYMLAARFQAFIFLHEIPLGLASSARPRAHHRGRAVVVMDGDGAVTGVMLRNRMVGVEGVITSHRGAGGGSLASRPRICLLGSGLGLGVRVTVTVTVRGVV